VNDLEAFKIGLAIAEAERRDLAEFCRDMKPEHRPILIGEPEVEAKDGLVVITERVAMPPGAQFVTLNILE